MSTTRTYYCGRSAGVRKLVDLTGPWIDVSLPPSIPDATGQELFDVEVDPNDGEKVFVVGDAHCDKNWYGIAVSSNGGTSWQIPGGNYQNIVTGAAVACYYKWVEISIVDSSTIYVCGVLSTITNKPVVIKSIDGGLTFNVCSPLPSVVDGMDATSIHFVTPLIGVVGLNNHILRTMDGGATWLVMNNGQPLSSSNPFPNTPLQVGQITGIYISDDLGYIMGVGQNMIVETAPVVLPNPPASSGVGQDSWQNNFYTASNGFSNLPLGQHLAYIKNPVGPPYDGTIAVTGLSSLGIHTNDRGTSWITTPAPGYDPTNNGFNRIAAHFYLALNAPTYSVIRGFYNKDNNVYYNLNGFDSGSESFSETSPYGVNAIWTWILEDVQDPCYLITNCEGTVSFLATGNFAGLVSQGVAFTLPGYPGCWTASISDTCVNPINFPVIGNATTCALCVPDPPICYLLEDCAGNLPDIITDSFFGNNVGQIITLASYPGVCWSVSISPTCSGSVVIQTQVTSSFADCVSCLGTCYYLADCANNFPTIHTNTDFGQYVGKTIIVASFPGVCWQVITAPNCTGAVPFPAVVVTVHDNCEDCLQVCYRLVDCIGAKPPIITSTDLSAYLNKVIKIVGCDSVCYIVTSSATCEGSMVVEVDTSYDTCELCRGVIVPPIVPLRLRSVQPNYGAGECSVDFVEKVNCRYADQVFAKYALKKYGVKQCKEDEFDKWYIKKQLLKLNLIYDPSACIIPEVEEVCEPIVEPPVPIQCLAATSVTVQIVEPAPGPCLSAVINNVQFVYQLS